MHRVQSQRAKTRRRLDFNDALPVHLHCYFCEYWLQVNFSKVRPLSGEQDGSSSERDVHEPLRDPERFGETVASNRGMDVKTFEGRKEAVEWLNA